VGRRAVGIDLGADVVWAVAADGATIVEGAAFGTDELDDLVAWCDDAVVAVDAPAGPSEGRHVGDTTLAAKFRPARCAEVALRRAGHSVAWVTPPDGPYARWMEAGFRVFAALDRLGPLEVFPYAVFAELLGGRPPRKQTLAGRRARLGALAARLELPESSQLWGHDGIDAAAACLVAVEFARGDARRVACDDHDGGSAMWLPAP
jgi:predicted nuclease with RNAse H fold